jgi:hypothetical protein
MADAPSLTLHVQACLDRLRGGDETARAELLGCACERRASRYRPALFVPMARGQPHRPGDYVATYGATSSTINPLGTCTNQPGSTGPVLPLAGYDDINNKQALILS